MRREYIFHTRLLLANATIIKFGYLYNLITLHGFVIPHSTLAFLLHVKPTRSSDFFRWIVSGSKKYAPMSATPAKAVCRKKITRQDWNVTMIPPMKGPNAGPIKVPERNHPIAVARSVGR